MRASPEYRLAMLHVLGLRAVGSRDRPARRTHAAIAAMTTRRIAPHRQRADARSVDVAPHHTLLEVLRDDLGLTGTKECCLVGECGACTVLVDGRSVDSCLMLAVEADGRAVTTVEGLAAGDQLHPLQQAFLDTGAAQCGFCIPGQLDLGPGAARAQPAPDSSRGRGRARRQPVPLRRLRADHRGRAGGGRGRRGPRDDDRGATSRGAVGRPGRERGAAVSVGEPAARVGGRARVTGEQQYVADLPHDDALHVKLVALDVARARIGRIDATAALEVPGVRLVTTPADLPDPMPRFGPQRRDRPVLATGETKYHGEPVAAVAAETHDAAEEAAALVSVEFEELPALHTIAQALAPDAPLVQDPSLRPGDPCAATNVLHEHRHGWGDVDGAAGEADVVVEGTYAFPMVTQFAIEPHAYMAAPDGDGIAVWSAIQHPYWLQRVIADLLGLPLSKVRVFAPDPGGAFGGKQHAKYEPLLAFMARATGRKVRLVLTLEETFQAVRRGASEVHVRTGFRRDGTLVFRDIEANYLIGAYADIADRTVAKGSYTSNGPYRVPNVRILARSVLSHTVPSTAFRGFGNPQQIWAVESNMNEAARELGIDPLDLRLRNLAGPGEAFIPHDTPADGDWAQAVERAADMIGWRMPTPPGRGRGIAVGLKSGPTTGLSYSTVRLLVDGSVVVYAGTSDMGQGARTIFAQIAAQELGAPLDWVTVVMGDTAVVPYDQQTSASRSSVLMGNAVLAACRDIQAKLRAMAAELEGVDASAVVVEARPGPDRRSGDGRPGRRGAGSRTAGWRDHRRR